MNAPTANRTCSHVKLKNGRKDPSNAAHPASERINHPGSARFMTIQATHGRDGAHMQVGIAVRSGGSGPCLGLVHHEDGADQRADGADQHEPVTEAQAPTGALVDDEIGDCEHGGASSNEFQPKPRNPPGGYRTLPNRTNATITPAMAVYFDETATTENSP